MVTGTAGWCSVFRGSQEVVDGIQGDEYVVARLAVCQANAASKCPRLTVMRMIQLCVCSGGFRMMPQKRVAIAASSCRARSDNWVHLTAATLDLVLAGKVGRSRWWPRTTM